MRSLIHVCLSATAIRIMFDLKYYRTFATNPSNISHRKWSVCRRWQLYAVVVMSVTFHSILCWFWHWMAETHIAGFILSTLPASFRAPFTQWCVVLKIFYAFINFLQQCALRSQDFVIYHREYIIFENPDRCGSVFCPDSVRKISCLLNAILRVWKISWQL